MVRSKEQIREEKLALARNMFERGGVFPFPGIDAAAYTKLKATEEPEYATPIDEIIERCTREGVKVVLGNNPGSLDVFILPAGSDDIIRDSLFPRHLNGTVAGESLQKLIKLDKSA